MPSTTSHLIGIAGRSGSGKTTLAFALADALVDAAVLPMDAYYRDLAYLDSAARARRNFDRPGAFDWEPFVADLRALRRRETVQRPSYNFTTHTRRREAVPIEPQAYLIVEGLLVLCRPDVRTLLDTTVFLEVDDQTAIDRRMARDRRDRGRAPSAVRAQYARDVRPMFERYVHPTARWAELTLSGDSPVQANVERVATLLMGR